jgi:hypothetical protein
MVITVGYLVVCVVAHADAMLPGATGLALNHDLAYVVFLFSAIAIMVITKKRMSDVGENVPAVDPQMHRVMP